MPKLSVKHFELLTQGSHVSWNYIYLIKNAQNVFVTFMEKWKKNEYRKIAKISPSMYKPLQI